MTLVQNQCLQVSSSDGELTDAIIHPEEMCNATMCTLSNIKSNPLLRATAAAVDIASLPTTPIQVDVSPSVLVQVSRLVSPPPFPARFFVVQFLNVITLCVPLSVFVCILVGGSDSQH